MCSHILYAQRSRARGEKVAELKAEGLDYHERMEALEDVTWPKPEEDWVYATFNAYVADRPWITAEHIRPKSIARELYETWSSFTEYIRELRIPQVEGVLLRYLSQVYRVLVRSIPEALQTDALLDAIAFLRSTLARTDSSLVKEWEELAAPSAETPDEPPPAPDISRNPRTFTARVRSELHQVVHALARRNWEEAAACLRPGEHSWGPDELEEALQPYLEEHAVLRFDHASRLASATRIQPLGGKVWEVSQRLLDPEEESMWFLEGRVDLSRDANPDGPLVELVRIGS